MNKLKSASNTDALEKHVYNEIIQGATNSNLVDKIANDYWGVGLTYSGGSARNLITRVRKQIRADWEEDLPEVKQTMMARLLSLYNEALEAKDRNTALNTLKYIGTITGADAPQKMDINLNGNIEINFDL